MIIKPWDAEVNLTKSDIRSVPIWIQLENLELKYWGEKTLFKIVGQLGTPIELDAYTKEKNRLAYPRILIEVQLEQTLEDSVQFEDEYGRLNAVKVVYEWKPTICKNCSGIGHETANCKKHVTKKQEWVVKRPVLKKQVEVDSDGFQKVVGSVKSKGKLPVAETSTSNHFEILEQLEETAEAFQQIVKTGEWGVPSKEDG